MKIDIGKSSLIKLSMTSLNIEERNEFPFDTLDIWVAKDTEPVITVAENHIIIKCKNPSVW